MYQLYLLAHADYVFLYKDPLKCFVHGLSVYISLSFTGIPRKKAFVYFRFCCVVADMHSIAGSHIQRYWGIVC